MKKQVRKLTINRETIRNLEAPILVQVVGGWTITGCGDCTTNFTCNDNC